MRDLTGLGSHTKASPRRCGKGLFCCFGQFRFDFLVLDDVGHVAAGIHALLVLIARIDNELVERALAGAGREGVYAYSKWLCDDQRLHDSNACRNGIVLRKTVWKRGIDGLLKMVDTGRTTSDVRNVSVCSTTVVRGDAAGINR